MNRCAAGRTDEADSAPVAAIGTRIFTRVLSVRITMPSALRSAITYIPPWIPSGGCNWSAAFCIASTAQQRKMTISYLAAVMAVLTASPCGQIAAQTAHSGFHADLTGGSKDVPNHLAGDPQVRSASVEFVAFPQIYTVTWSCSDLHNAGSLMRRKRIRP